MICGPGSGSGNQQNYSDGKNGNCDRADIRVQLGMEFGPKNLWPPQMTIMDMMTVHITKLTCRDVMERICGETGAKSRGELTVKEPVLDGQKKTVG